MSPTPKPVVVITGAGKREGLGFEVGRQLAQKGHTVLLTAREGSAAEALARGLAAEGLDVHGDQLDVTSEAEVLAFARRVEARFGRVDVLVNNAAGPSVFDERPSTADLKNAHALMEVILFGAWRTTQALFPLLRKSPRARVVNVSSGAGSHGDLVFGLDSHHAVGPGYAVAKAALNALTASFANELRPGGGRVNAVCPGFTATFPGAEKMGARPVKEGAAGVVWAATLQDDGPTGGFFRDGEPLAW